VAELLVGVGFAILLLLVGLAYLVRSVAAHWRRRDFLNTQTICFFDRSSRLAGKQCFLVFLLSIHLLTWTESNLVSGGNHNVL
jgi:hypothetical protein